MVIGGPHAVATLGAREFQSVGCEKRTQPNVPSSGTDRPRPGADLIGELHHEVARVLNDSLSRLATPPSTSCYVPLGFATPSVPIWLRHGALRRKYRKTVRIHCLTIL